MTTDRDFDRIASAWLADGPDELPDRVLDAVVDQIHVTQQRHALRLPWRFSTMTTPARVAAAAVIGVLAIGGALFVFNGRSSVGGPGPTPKPSPSTLSVASTTPSPSPRADYPDFVGRLLVQHFGNAFDGTELSSDYHSERARFYLVNPDGSGLRELAPGTPPGGKNMADISPDGTKVVFQDWPSTGASKIYEVGLDGSGLRTLSAPCACSEGDPAYSPDGSRIAFTRQTGADRQVGILDLATGRVTMLPATAGTAPVNSTSDVPEQPSWSPDGKAIIYAMMKRDSGGNLLSSRIDQIEVSSSIVTELPLSATLSLGEPKYSPDGRLILLSSRPGYATIGQRFGDVYTVHPDGTGLMRLTTSESTGANWTPDGKHILFVSGKPPGQGDGGLIWLMDPDGSNKAPWSLKGPNMSTNERGFGYTTYWIPPAP